MRPVRLIARPVSVRSRFEAPCPAEVRLDECKKARTDVERLP